MRALTSGRIASASATARPPDGSVKSFWTSTTTSAVDASYLSAVCMGFLQVDGRDAGLAGLEQERGLRKLCDR